MNRLTFKAFDDKIISYCEWPIDDPKAIVVISHGMCEHMLRYEHFAKELNKAGFLVVGEDHRGHGETDSQTLGYSSGNMFYDTLNDIATLCKLYKDKYPHLKVVLFSHSYGSFLAQRFVQEYGNLISGVIFGGSANMQGFLPRAGKLIANIGCTFKGKNKPAVLINNMTFGSYTKQLNNSSFISSIESEVSRYESDPKCGFICSYNFYKGFFGGLVDAYKTKNLNKIDINMPMAIISGSSDPVGGFGKLTTKLYDMYVDLGVQNIKIKLYDNVRHEYLNDTSRADAINYIIDFIKSVA